MTSAEVRVLRPSPWLSVWFSPRKTIERIVATNPRRHVLLLAGLGAMGTVLAVLIGRGVTTELMDWGGLASVAIAGLVLGVAGLYINGLAYKWSGRILGGRATYADVRAAFAWAAMPNIIGLAICLVVLMGLKLAGTPKPTSSELIAALAVIAVVLWLWSWVAAILMLGRVHGFGFWRAIASFALGALFVWLFAVSFRTFVFQPFNIPARGLQPTLLVGDYFFVSKVSYGYSHYSLPFSPRLFSGRIFGSEPERGDIVVFRLPKDDSVDYIFRVIGLPGDRVQMINGHLHINGEPVKRERIEDFIDTDDSQPRRVKRWRETLPNGVSYSTLDLIDNGPYDNTRVYDVPPGQYFVMGDNRDNSNDSRVGVGTVPFENLVGRAQIIFFSTDWVRRVRFERLGSVVR